MPLFSMMTFPRRVRLSQKGAARALLVVGAAALAVLPPASAYALQPLAEFLEHAKTWNPDNRAAHATVDQRDAEIGVASGNLAPNLQFNGLYTHNEFEAAFPVSPGVTLIVQPYNQVDGNVTFTVPIINVANWDRRGVSKATLAAAKADESNSGLSVTKNVTRDYYQLLGYEAVLQSAVKNLDVAKHNVQLARDKKESGTGSELDVQRALADAAKAEQSVTSAQLSVTNSRRDLYSLSGVSAEPGATFPDDDLHEETSLEGWMSSAGTVPSVKSAEASRESADEASHAARTGWLPTVNGIAEEKFTNNSVFSGGHAAYYLVQLTANWRLDFTIIPQIKQQNAIAAAARANEDKVRIAAQDSIYKDWQQIRADIEVSRSARAQVASTKLAASLAEDRYTNGVATQLDVLQARQDAFAADVARIQADSDLAYARTALRIDSGRYSGAEERR
jgi:outer membrane protein TolC